MNSNRFFLKYFEKFGNLRPLKKYINDSVQLSKCFLCLKIVVHMFLLIISELKLFIMIYNHLFKLNFLYFSLKYPSYLFQE